MHSCLADTHESRACLISAPPHAHWCILSGQLHVCDDLVHRGESSSSLRQKRGSGLRHVPPLLHQGAGQYEKIDEADNEIASQSSFHRGASTESKNRSLCAKSQSRPSLSSNEPEPPATDTPQDDGTLAAQSDDCSREGSQERTFQQSQTTAETGVMSPRGNPPSNRQSAGADRQSSDGT